MGNPYDNYCSFSLEDFFFIKLSKMVPLACHYFFSIASYHCSNCVFFLYFFIFLYRFVGVDFRTELGMFYADVDYYIILFVDSL